MASLIKFKIKPLSPKRSARILIVGRSGSGRTSVMKRLCEKLGFIAVSTSELLVDQVRNKTELGQKMYQDIAANTLISDEIVFGIIRARLNRIDCKSHGFVLEGFPKTYDQVKLMQEMKLDPNFVIYLDCTSDMAKQRICSRHQLEGKEITPEVIQKIEER